MRRITDLIRSRWKLLPCLVYRAVEHFDNYGEVEGCSMTEMQVSPGMGQPYRLLHSTLELVRSYAPQPLVGEYCLSRVEL